MYYTNSSDRRENYSMLEGGKVVVKKMKLVVVLCMMLLMGLFAGSIYASDNAEGYNVKVEQTTDKNGKTVEYLASVSDNGYLRITQIIQNSQNVKIDTSTFEGKLLISGKIKKDTEVTIKVFNQSDEEAAATYNLSVGVTEAFSQSVEIAEGDNTIIISYTNKKDNKEDYISFFVSRGSKENMEEIKSYLAIPRI